MNEHDDRLEDVPDPSGTSDRAALQGLLDDLFGADLTGRLTSTFPARLLDKNGSVLTPGTSVTVVSGEHRGERGIVHGWAGEDLVAIAVEGAGTGRPSTPPTSSERFATPPSTNSPELAELVGLAGPRDGAGTEDQADPDEPVGSDHTTGVEPASTTGLEGIRLPAVVAASDMVCNPDPGAGRRIGVEVVSPDDIPTVLVVPVGGRDVQALSGDPGPFPAPTEFSSGRAGAQSKVDARRWGAACLEAVAHLSVDEQARLVARHLDAPMLRRVLSEAVLPAELQRLTLVVTDQATIDRPDGHVDDSLHFGRLLELWVQGTESRRTRRIREFGEPIVLTSRPNVTHAVLATIRRSIDAVVAGCEEVVIVQAGGTPAMFTGLETAVTSRPGLRVRITQPVEDGPLYDVVAG